MFKEKPAELAITPELVITSELALPLPANLRVMSAKRCGLASLLLKPFKVRKTTQDGFFPDRIFRSTPNGVLTDGTYWVAARCATGIQYHLCSIHRRLWGWWSSGCCGSVAERWRLKPEVSWVQLPVTAGFFTFLYFRLITSKFIYFQHEARCFQHLRWVLPLQAYY